MAAAPNLFGTPLTASLLSSTMQQLCTRIHVLVHDAQRLNDLIQTFSDGQLEQVFIDAGADASTATAQKNEIRDWQYAVQQFYLNYSGSGVLNDNSFQLAKRVIPQI